VFLASLADKLFSLYENPDRNGKATPINKAANPIQRLLRPLRIIIQPVDLRKAIMTSVTGVLLVKSPIIK
jgi:hypothetical protein